MGFYRNMEGILTTCTKGFIPCALRNFQGGWGIIQTGIKEIIRHQRWSREVKKGDLGYIQADPTA